MKKIGEIFGIFSQAYKTSDATEGFLSRVVSSAARERAKYIEMMAAAYLKETKIPIRHCILIEKPGVNGISYFFADKRENKEIL